MNAAFENISPQLAALLWALKPLEKAGKVSVKEVLAELFKEDPSYKGFYAKFPKGKRVDLKKLVEAAFLDAFEAASPQVGLDHLFLALASLLGGGEYVRAKEYALSRRGNMETRRKFLFEAVKDITSMEELGLLQNIVVREKEVNLLIQKLLRPQRKNLLLLGPKGVGKTALLYGLAKKIVNWDVPKDLIGTRVISVNAVSLANAPISIRGYIEDNLGSIMEQRLGKKNKAILFFNNLHLLPLGISFGMSVKAANRYIRFIGEAEDSDNLRILENPLGALWEPFPVSEPSLEDMKKIIKAWSRELSESYGIDVSLPALEEMLNWNLDLIYPAQAMPGKLLSILDMACAKKKLLLETPPRDLVELNREMLRLKRKIVLAVQRKDLDTVAKLDNKVRRLEKVVVGNSFWNKRKVRVGRADVRNFLARELGLELPFPRLINILKRDLRKNIVGQSEAIDSLVSAVRRSSLRLKGESRPIGSFLFLGATGVGKTETAKVLAKALFPEGKNFIRLDMSDFRERHTVSRLVGAPPGYVGFEEGGQLTEFVRENPKSVVLFDEVEKAHKDVLNILLQVMEEGELVDGSGVKVSFKDTIIILTGNIGSGLIGKGSWGFSVTKGGSHPQGIVRERIVSEAKKVLKPEFLNRLDAIIVFKILDKGDLYKICGLLVEEFKESLAEKGITLKVLASAKKWLVEKSFSVEYGARPLRRLIEKELVDKVAEMVLENKVRFGDTLKVVCSRGALVLIRDF